MTIIENLPSPQTERPIGFGRLKRKEDARFIRGKGNYLDDIRLPGMVYGAMLRSPYAHAKIVSIDTSRALAHPGVAAVITAKDLTTLIDVEYEPLPAVVNARKALDDDAPLIRDDKAGQRDNLASPTWEAGDEEATNKAFAE